MKEINGQFYGYSSELKTPTTVEDLTTCYAVDTGTVFVAYGGIWYEQPGVMWLDGGSSSGGGGGGGTSSGLVINLIDPNEDGNLIMDKTWQEIYDAVSAGGSAVVLYSEEDSGTTYVMARPVTFVGKNSDSAYYVNFFPEYNSSRPTVWVADSADGYPTEAII